MTDTLHLTDKDTELFMIETTIERDSDLPIRFTGEIIAEVDSYVPGKSRWTALNLYRTSTGRYVLHEEGLTEIDGESDRSSAVVASDVDELIGELYKVNASGKRYMTRLAQDLLFEASAVDGDIQAACVVEV